MINPVAYSYWRRIKAGAKEYSDVPKAIKEDVKAVAQNELDEGIISQEDFDKWIGEE